MNPPAARAARAVQAATPLPSRDGWPVFWIASGAVFLVALDTTVMFTAFPALVAAFPESSPATLSWVINAYTVFYSALLIPAGGLADTYGRRRLFLAGGSVFLLGSALCGSSPTVAWLIGARIVQAIGAAMLVPASLSLVLDAFPLERRAFVVSLWGAVGALAAALGPSLGSLLIDGFGWPWAFLVNLPIGGVALWWGLSRLRESRREGVRPRLDIVGIVLLVTGVGAIALAIVQADAPGWMPGRVAMVATIGLLAMLVLFAWSRRASQPLVEPALFAFRHYRWVNYATFSFGIGFAMMLFGFFFYMTGVWGYSLPRAGIAITPGPLLVIPAAIIAGRFASRFGHQRLLVGGGLLFAVAAAWFGLVPDAEPAYLRHWLPGLLLAGCAIGMVLPSLGGAAVSRLPPDHYAIGSAVNQATRNIGSVVGVAITVLMLGGAELARADFDAFYAVLVVLALATALLALPVDTRLVDTRLVDTRPVAARPAPRRPG